MTIIAQSTDAEILAAITADAVLLDRLKEETRAAFCAARHSESDWVKLDAQFTALQHVMLLNKRLSDATNPNSPADQAARVATVRALLEARDDFIAQTPNTRPRVSLAVPTHLTALRLSGVYDPAQEALLAAGAFGPERVLEGTPTFTPGQVPKPQRQHARAMSLIGARGK